MLSLFKNSAPTSFFLSSDQQWRRKLKQLVLSRPRLHKAEYIEMLVEKGFSRKQVRTVYEVLNRYVSFDGFSLYPHDDIRKFYLKDEENFSPLLDRIYSKLKLKRKDQLVKHFLNKNFEVVTIETILMTSMN